LLESREKTKQTTCGNSMYFFSLTYYLHNVQKELLKVSNMTGLTIIEKAFRNEISG